MEMRWWQGGWRDDSEKADGDRMVNDDEKKNGSENGGSVKSIALKKRVDIQW